MMLACIQSCGKMSALPVIQFPLLSRLIVFPQSSRDMTLWHVLKQVTIIHVSHKNRHLNLSCRFGQDGCLSGPNPVQAHGKS
jgi:hypothetical protein